MKDTYIKKYWEEDNILYYIHFQNEEAMRQIEISSTGKVCLSIDKPALGDSFLYDKGLKDLDLDSKDFITEQEFEEAWNR